MIRPILEYGDIIFDNCSIKDKNALEAVQRKAGLICTGAYKHTEHQHLLDELGWETLHDRRQKHKLIQYYKITQGFVPPYLNNLLPELTASTIRYNLRREQNRRQFTCRLTHYQNSFFPSTTKAWNSLDDRLKNIIPPSVNIFKNQINSLNRPVKNNYYNMASGKTGIWLARLRMGLSALNAHRFNFHFINSSLCNSCNLGSESTIHYFFWCPTYGAARATFMGELSMNLGINTNNQSLLLQTLLHGTGSIQQDNTLLQYLSEYFTATK